MSDGTHSAAPALPSATSSATPATPATPAITAESVSKRYRRTTPGYQLRTLKSALLGRSLVRGLTPEESIAALDGVSFTISPGEAFGVVGGNGSGKSTLLKIVAGILHPTSGRVLVRGRVSALIELGAGFHPEISGRENIYINAAVLGLSRREVDSRFDEIVEFSGLGEFIDEPVKNYSSGMYVRLGFSVAVHTAPDVLLVDEVLAVGDEAFAHRCLRRIEELLAGGKTLLFVSHSLDLVENLCDRVLWLEHGRPRLIGHPRQVVDAYRLAVAEEEGRLHAEARKDAEAAGEGRKGRDGLAPGGEVLRWGNQAATITAVRLLGRDGSERYQFESGEEVTIEVQAQSPAPLTDFVFGVAIATPRGVECWGTNSDLAGFTARRWQGAARVRVVVPALRLGAGEYLVDVAVHSRTGVAYDYRRRALALTVTARAPGVGVYAPEHRWEFGGGVEWEPGTRGGLR